MDNLNVSNNEEKNDESKDNDSLRISLENIKKVSILILFNISYF